MSNENALATMTGARLAGGLGAISASQGPEAQLRLAVMSCLLWEDIAYESGYSVAANIAACIPQVAPAAVASIAVEARIEQKLRHVPLFICREMLRYPEHKKLVRATLSQCIRRPDEMLKFAVLYWESGGKLNNLPKQAKLGLADAFGKFDEYQLAKYNRPLAYKSGQRTLPEAVRLVDLIRLCHPVPANDAQAELWCRLIDGKLATPETWEVGLSAAKTADEKRDVWLKLLASRKLGASALLKNLSGMLLAGVPTPEIAKAMQTAKVEMLLPLDFFKAATHAPTLTAEIEQMMYRCLAGWPKLPGETILIVDVSGSMGMPISARSTFTRMDAAAAMAVLAKEVCERVSIYVTAGNDNSCRHKTARINDDVHGFALGRQVVNSSHTMGGGGIFTRQCLEYIQTARAGSQMPNPDRIAVFSDSQDCDRRNAIPNPFGINNYIVDVGAHSRGINYAGVWTAEIAGWSEQFLRFIAGIEGVATPDLPQ